MEWDPDGAAFLRVQEQAYSAFEPQQTLANRSFGPAPGVNNVISGAAPMLVSNIDVVGMKYGLSLQASGMVQIYDYTYNQIDCGGCIFGGAIAIGPNGKATTGSTYIQRVVADGMQAPDPTYKLANTDFISIEPDSGPIFIRDVSGKNFSDAMVDTKSNQIYIMNATLDHAHRVLRAWSGVEIIVVNSIINGTADNAQAWVNDTTSTIRYWNTLWCLDAVNPSASDPNCRTTPWMLESEDLDAPTIASRIIPLQSNPLPGISPFFATNIDEIVIEYSSNGGSTWRVMNVPNTGGPGSAPIGDTRYRIPIALNTANFLFRASYRKNGGLVGSMSAVINEQGQTQ